MTTEGEELNATIAIRFQEELPGSILGDNGSLLTSVLVALTMGLGREKSGRVQLLFVRPPTLIGRS